MENKRENYTQSDAQKANLSASICVHLRLKKYHLFETSRKSEKTLYINRMWN